MSNLSKLIGSFGLAFLLLGVEAKAETQLLPGLKYYGTREKLSGKLVFNLTDRNYQFRNKEHQSTIYEFDLQHERLRKLTRAPGGIFIASMDGKVFCILVEGRWIGTNAFLYSSTTQKVGTVDLDSVSRQTVIVGNHAFFKLDYSGKESILEYDLSLDKKRMIELTNASTWQYQKYTNLHAPADTTNTLHFEYRPAGTRTGSGRNYPMGFYSLDVETGNIRWFAERDGEPFTFKSVDGKYIFFEGPDNPVKGYRLVSSAWSHETAEERKANSGDVKSLHSFGKLVALTGGAYWLQQMSPCRRYALVRLSSTGGTGATSSYFIVNVSTGDTRMLLRDTVGPEGAGFMSEVSWVAGSGVTSK
jgi:hypothetical protein